MSLQINELMFFKTKRFWYSYEEFDCNFDLEGDDSFVLLVQINI